MRNERLDPIDALIDSAARQMVAGEPSSSLRSAVRDRVERRRSPWLMMPAIAGVAAAAVIAAVIVGRGLSGGPGERESVRPTAAPGTIERAAAPTTEPASQLAAAPAVVEDVRQVQATRLTRRLADDVAAQAQLPPEEEPMIPPIAIEPLETVQIAIGNAIAVESSGVMPIEIEPLQIEPLRGIE